MFGLRRFRFRSPERNRETEERRLARIKGVVHSAVLEAEAELKGVRARIVGTRRSVMSLLAQVEEREPDPACRVDSSILNGPFSPASEASRNWKIILRLFGNWSDDSTASLINHACLLSRRPSLDRMNDLTSKLSALNLQIFRRGLAAIGHLLVFNALTLIQVG
jgi:hypothetical protein